MSWNPDTLEYRLQRKPRISRRAAHEMVLLFAKAGNHIRIEFRLHSDADVKRIYAAHGIDFSRLVEAARDPATSVPLFENLIGSTLTISGVTASRVDLQSGEELEKFEGPGVFTFEGYWAEFEIAQEAWERGIAKPSYSDLVSAVVHGVASVEGFLVAQISEWNRKHPDQQLIDSKQHKVPFDQKITEWVPAITGGRKLDRSRQHWRDFATLRNLRDDVAVHPKSASRGARFEDMVALANQFRTGIAGLLIDLHLLFGARIPRVIIRTLYSPEVELVVNHDPVAG